MSRADRLTSPDPPECSVCGGLRFIPQDTAWRRCVCHDDFEAWSRLRRACLPPRLARHTLDSWLAPTPVTQAVKARALAWLAACDLHSENQPGLALIGPVGTGKSHLAAALLRTLIADRGCTGLWCSVPELFERLHATFGAAPVSDETETDVLDELRRPTVLVLDDIARGVRSDWRAEILFRAVDWRVTHGGVLIVTSNAGLGRARGELARGGVAEMTDAAVASRLAGACEIIEFSGPDWREVTR